MRFAAVGIVCFSLQYLVLRLFTAAGVPATAADALGFALSAQLNFTLSTLFTWGDRKGAFTSSVRTRWLSFNASILLTLAINTGVFQLCRPLGDLGASALGVLVAAVGNYALCDIVVFRGRRGVQLPPTAPATELVPALAKEGR
ncbi:MAG TPA: GtrA family protein [Actinocrinis sp.]|uniref:GtrA family protein n=1 Tax=Actinocrinis sp. TaxID=1920516 RepID=UPI002DDCA427|nr:GtrA family protein [Actinocrinis sp.]HEV3174122.1 GtrA family protein [Actinocrinis sp.]